MIRIKAGYFLRDVLDMCLVMGTGSAAYQPNAIMSVNETGKLLWELLEKGAERGDLIAKLTEEYEVGEADAARDVDIFLHQLKEKALIEEC